MLAAVASVLFLAVANDPLVERLLSFPALPPSVAAPKAAAEKLTGDEPIDTLWTIAISRKELIAPAIRQRVVQRLAKEPEILPQVIPLLPETVEATETAWVAFGKTVSGR